VSDTADLPEEPQLTPEAERVIEEIEAAAAAAGFPIHGFAKLNAVTHTLVGPDTAPVDLGPTVELTVPIAADGAPLPPPGQRPKTETAAAVMIIRVAPERSFGVRCWRAWVNLVEVSSARAFFSQQSARPEENWDILATGAAPAGDTILDVDDRLDQAMSGLTALLPRSPGEAISQAFGAAADQGRLGFGREWDPPIQRLRYYVADEPDSPTASGSSDQTAEPSPDPSDPTDQVPWHSSFALVGVAAAIGLIVGLAILWVGGHADAGASLPHPHLLTGASEDGVDYDRILAFNYNGQHYPVALFRTAEPDLGCSVQHAHLSTIETLARSFEAPEAGIYDPDPPGCGFGAIESLAPAPYLIPHEQVHAFCDAYRREIPDWLGTATSALCDSRAPDSAQ
jgi:hypothetical protein